MTKWCAIILSHWRRIWDAVGISDEDFEAAETALFPYVAKGGM